MLHFGSTGSFETREFTIRRETMDLRGQIDRMHEQRSIWLSAVPRVLFTTSEAGVRQQRNKVDAMCENGGPTRRLGKEAFQHICCLATLGAGKIEQAKRFSKPVPRRPILGTRE